MKKLFILLFFLFGCSQDVSFVSSSVIQDISQRCDNLPPDIDRDKNSLKERHNVLVKRYNKTPSKIKEGKVKRKLGYELSISYYEITTFLKNNESIFIDCLGEKRFYLIVEYISLSEKDHSLVTKGNTLLFEIFKRIKRENHLPSHIYKSFEIFKGRLDEDKERKEELNKRWDELKEEEEKGFDYPKRIEFLKESISLLEEWVELLEGFLSYLKEHNI